MRLWTSPAKCCRPGLGALHLGATGLVEPIAEPIAGAARDAGEAGALRLARPCGFMAVRGGPSPTVCSMASSACEVLSAGAQGRALKGTGS